MERLSPSKPVLFLQTKVVIARKDDLASDSAEAPLRVITRSLVKHTLPLPPSLPPSLSLSLSLSPYVLIHYALPIVRIACIILLQSIYYIAIYCIYLLSFWACRSAEIQPHQSLWCGCGRCWREQTAPVPVNKVPLPCNLWQGREKEPAAEPVDARTEHQTLDTAYHSEESVITWTVVGKSRTLK